MQNYSRHLVLKDTILRDALKQLDVLGEDAVLIVTNENEQLIGSLTDGDVRRGLLKEYSLDNSIQNYIQYNPRFIRKSECDISYIKKLREENIRILPVLDDEGRIVNVVNLRLLKSYLPVDAVIMAGGRGTRLQPLTNTVPKPLLKIGKKPIIQHNLDRLASFGIDDFWISLRYKGEQVESFFGNGKDRSININYVWENEPLGTIGAAKKVTNFKHDYVLVTNSDILTNLDYEGFFLDFIERGADLSVVTIPYKVTIPYAVLETSNGTISDFREKPTYTYFSNGGIYLMKRKVIQHIPEGTFFNATDLLEHLIKNGNRVVSYPFHEYWLDIGKHDDFNKAQEDVKHIKF